MEGGDDKHENAAADDAGETTGGRVKHKPGMGKVTAEHNVWVCDLLCEWMSACE
jgi:hypothetical protein